MTIVQTVSVYVGIPAAIIAVLTLLVYGKTLIRQPNRYRPGRPWTHPDQWFVPHPDAVAQSGDVRAQIEGGSTSTTAVGGASGEW